MMQEPLTLYKLIILYMLDKVSFPLTKSQICDFVLEKEYTNFLTLQQVFSELTDKKMILADTCRNRTLLSISDEGKTTLRLLEDGLAMDIRRDIEDFLLDNEMYLRDEVSVLADYYKNASGEYETHLTAKDRQSDLVNITLFVPTEKMADRICQNWQSKSSSIYRTLVEELF